MKYTSYGVKVKRQLLSAIIEIRRQRTINGKVSARLRSMYGERFSKALRVLSNRGVKLFRFSPSGILIWMVEGKERDYLVIPLIYCDCDDFYLNVVIRGESDICYHLIAQAIAEALGFFTLIELPDELYERFIEAWLA